MVQWQLCPSCQRVVDEFESKCGWCFPRKKPDLLGERQLFLFCREGGNFENKDYLISADAHKVRELKLKKE
jgi:hypothetical protein